VREHCSHTVTRFVWGLRSKIRRSMIIDSYDLDTIEEAFDIALKIDLIFKRLVNAKTWCCKCEGYEHYDYQCPSKSRHVSIVFSDDVDDSKVDDVHVPSKTTSAIEDISVGSDTPILDEGYASYESTSEVEDAIVESGISLTVDVHVHDTSDFASKLVESSASSQIYRYSFATLLIEDEIDSLTRDN